MIGKKIAILGVVLICLFCISGCKTNQYNAELYDNAVEWINEDFIKNNYTSGAYYDDDIQTDDSYPKTRTYLIKNNEEKLNILNNKFNIDINFEQEMLIVYTWTTVYNRPCQIKGFELKENVLYVNFNMSSVSTGIGDAARPFQRWMVIKLDLLPIVEVELKKV